MTEAFTAEQTSTLAPYVSNTSRNIFVLKNLPEVIMGALFSRYSRSPLGLRSLLLKEFILSADSGFSEIASPTSGTSQSLAIQKAQSFYDRILDGYGDDSIGELGGAHLACENVTMLAAKHLQDARIGGSPLEKSTRYIAFDEKSDGKYNYLREPVLMTSAFGDQYVQTCDHLFDTYSSLIPTLTAWMQERFRYEEGTSKPAYTAALRAKVLDCLRGLLPTGTFTNVGIFGNGRFFETLIRRFQCENLAELKDIGQKMYTELSTVIPSFVRRAESQHRHQLEFQQFFESSRAELAIATRGLVNQIEDDTTNPEVRLVSSAPDNLVSVAAALLFSQSSKSLAACRSLCETLSHADLSRLMEAAAASRTNRRHKGPRALEHASFTFELVSDFGCYRDLQRHRTLTQGRQLLTCDLGYIVPQELIEAGLDGPYVEALEKAKATFEAIRGELPEEAQYVVPMGYNIRWLFHVNLRALQWLCELRSQPQGHATYRRLAQEMVQKVIEAEPAFKCFFAFVDNEGYELGRMGQETAKASRA